MHPEKESGQRDGNGATHVQFFLSLKENVLSIYYAPDCSLGTKARNKTHGACILMEETDIDTFKCNMLDSDKCYECKLNRIQRG